MTAVEIWRNTWGPVLVYRFAAALRFRRQDFTVPILYRGRLAGMLNWYRLEDSEGGCSSLPFLRNFLERS